ncbi:SpoIIE family protein phosphatase [Leptospira sp. GIMC2001]|uniref:SpoIIE family protein phosphatase n=1 Tax=Leptospira sp. GIMC2001 TaxID=1513297 RepID=UPI00234AFC53|nr:SpoIIE family protein phosphatase [Leptospira sp. GIMC2001]WCL47551.1 SpoIIE family protein phosphatase [Leptospira sp. GIMC2001]
MSDKKLTLKLISDITARINSSDDLESLLPAIMDTTKKVLDSEGCSLLLYDKETDCLVFDITVGEKREILSKMQVPRGKGIAGMVLETLQPEIVNDAANDTRVYKNIDHEVGFITRNLICVPMVANGEVQGVLEAVNSIDFRDYTDKDIKILKYLSDLAAISIRNRKLIDELQARANELDCLFQISQSLSNVIDIDQFLASSVKSISGVMKVNKVAILFQGSENKGYDYILSRGFPESIEDLKKGEGPLDKILESVRTVGQTVTLKTHSSSTAEELSKMGYFKQNFLIIPIKRNRDTVGVLLIADKNDMSSFEDSDIRILSTISNQIAEAFTALRVKDQSEKLKYIQRDLQVAAQIQRNSLPHIPDSYGNLDFATFYKASRDIGGDFYDMIIHSPTEISVMIADVSGKGTPAALFMELSKTIISSEAARETSPRIALTKANQIIQDKSGFVLFVTVMLVRINTVSKTLTFSSAGHNRQFLYRKQQQEISLLSGKGTPLGIGKSEISEHTVDYEPGDYLILYTDGVTEVMNSKDEMYEEERLMEDILSMELDSAIGMRDKILDITNKFQGDAEQHDDYTLFIVKLQ